MRRFAISGAAALVLIVLSTNGFAKPPIPVTGCETISKRGNYVLENDLVFTLNPGGGGNCLVINSSHVNVDLNGQAITCILSGGFPTPCGPEFGLAGIGIDIEADHVSVANGNVDGFTVGIFGGADHISSTNLSLATGVGIVLNNVSHSAFTDIGYEGVFDINGGPESFGPVLSVGGGGNNTFTSIKSTGARSPFEGIIIGNSSNNVIDGAAISCAAEGRAGPGILLTPGSNHNFITNSNIFVVFGNGIQVDLGSDDNVIQNNTVETISPPGFFALFDQNPDCGSNLWINNVFNNEFVAGQTSANPVGCIH
jgi:hypothetical protein